MIKFDGIIEAADLLVEVLLYGLKYWQGIKFGDLAVLCKIAKF